ncbi:alpha/beta fold hydrolase [Thetidibacter halocola]|uniref:Alpha/beta hydrolase n=1 Tax=Thetidibacter halocola TaxID=2827239 RepID=A0A8J8B5Q5_9RHOB|nr:alpha/beta fold hydrolase [Thetidibacter halocola]MBS0123181.1 alpha/beta hydrolase [Thetidibacter halocola]
MRHAFADCLLDTETLTLTRAGSAVPVEPQVFDLLRLLVENAGRVVTRDEIVETVWKGRIVSESAISARIAAVRKAVGDDGKTQAVIRTVARRGLQMVAEVHDAAEPATPPAPQAQPPRTTAAPHVRYTRNGEGHTLAWTATGTGPPVLRIGAPFINIVQQWTFPLERAVIETVSARHRLVRFDGAGFGLSEEIAESFELMRLVGDCLAVADAAGLDRFAFMAESGASQIAVRLAALCPERISKLVLVGGYVDGRARRDPSPPPDPIRGLIEEGWKTRGSGLALAYQLSYFPEGPMDALHELAKLEQVAITETMILDMRDKVNNDSIAEFLPRVRCPTLIIQGRDNAVHPLGEARKLAAGIPDSQLVVLDTANHVPLPGNAVWPNYIETLLAFLSENAQGGDG